MVEHTKVSSSSASANELYSYKVLFVSLILDLLGFTLILPLIPSLLDHYSRHDQVSLDILLCNWGNPQKDISWILPIDSIPSPYFLTCMTTILSFSFQSIVEWFVFVLWEIDIKLFQLDPITTWVWSSPLWWITWLLVFIPSIFGITLCWKCFWCTWSERSFDQLPRRCYTCILMLVMFKLLIYFVRDIKNHCRIIKGKC